MTLEEILKAEKKHKNYTGKFGIIACKESILSDSEFYNKSLYTLLGEYVERANRDIFFNRTMILACWELINDR